MIVGYRSDVGRIFGVVCSTSMERYLILPSMVDRDKKCAFSGLRDCVRNRIMS